MTVAFRCKLFIGYFASRPIAFTNVPLLGVFATQRRSWCSLARSASAYQISPWSPQGWGLWSAPKTKKWNFTNIIAHKVRVPCTIFTKFIRFMRVLSLHNFAKFGCFISINDKIINNLLRWGRFQPNGQRPLAAKLWMWAKIFLT